MVCAAVAELNPSALAGERIAFDAVAPDEAA